MATITANSRPISRYRAPVPRRQLPPIPPQWLGPASPFREPPPLSHFVLLSMLLHVLFIALFGAPSGGSREGRAMWGSMQVELRGALVDSGRAPFPAPLPEERKKADALPEPRRQDRGASEGAVPMTPPAETQAAAVAPSGPAIVEVPTPFPRLLDRVSQPETQLVEPPALRVPPPTEGRDLRPPPRERLAPSAVQVPEPLPLSPEARSERALAEPPPLATPLLQALPEPLPEPVAAPAPRAAEPAAALAEPETPPVAAPPVAVRSIPIPTLETLAVPASDLARPVAMAPMPEIHAAPAPPPAGRIAPPPARIDAPLAAPPAGLRGPDAGVARARRPGDASSDYDPTAPSPSLDLDAIRSRAGQIAREGSGQSALLPFPMPAVPEKKSKMEQAIENARKPDCRTAYQGLGLAAIVPLIANEFGEGKCRW